MTERMMHQKFGDFIDLEEHDDRVVMDGLAFYVDQTLREWEPHCA